MQSKSVLEKLKAERDALGVDVSELNLFANSAEFKKVPVHHRQLIEIQLNAMRTHLCALDARINILEVESTDKRDIDLEIVKVSCDRLMADDKMHIHITYKHNGVLGNMQAIMEIPRNIPTPELHFKSQAVDLVIEHLSKQSMKLSRLN